MSASIKHHQAILCRERQQYFEEIAMENSDIQNNLMTGWQIVGGVLQISMHRAIQQSTLQLLQPEMTTNVKKLLYIGNLHFTNHRCEDRKKI